MSKTVRHSPPQAIPSLLTQTVLAIVYILAAKLSAAFDVEISGAFAVWIPSGIAAAAVLTLGYRAIPGVSVGAFVTCVLFEFEPLTSLGITIGNTLEAVCATYLVRRRNGQRNPFARSSDTVWFLAAAVAVSTTISATIGVASLCWWEGEKWSQSGDLWKTWWLGDSVGMLVITPFVLSWWYEQSYRMREIRTLEGVAFSVILVTISCLAFGHVGSLEGMNFPLHVLTMPVLLWAAFRFGLHGTMSALVVVAAFAVWGSHYELGPFFSTTVRNSMLATQGFVGITASSILLLTAALNERHQSGAQLRQTESRYRLLFDQSPDAVVVVDLRTERTIRVNNAASQLFGYSAKELQAMSLRDFAEGLDARHFYDQIVKAFNEDERWFESGIRHKSGQRIDVLVKCATIADSESSAVLVLLSDISQQKKRQEDSEETRHNLEAQVRMRTRELSTANAVLQREMAEREKIEEELREINARFEDIASNIPGMIYQTIDNTEGTAFRMLYVNGLVKEQFGWTPAEIYEDPQRWITAIHPDDRERKQKIIDETRRRAESFSAEHRVVSRSGEVRWVRASSKRRLLENGMILSNGIIIDVTERRRAEEALRAYRDELEMRVSERTSDLKQAIADLKGEVSERRRVENWAVELQSQLARASRASIMGEMAAGFAHEVHQPLAVIANYANGCVRRILRDDAPDEKIIKSMRTIVSESMRAAKIVRRIRSFVQRRELKREPLDVNTTIRDAVELARFRSHQFEVAINFQAATDLPEVYGDRIQITQVVLNLILNAIDAFDAFDDFEITAAEPKSLQISTQTQQANEEFVEVTVFDNGRGISPEDHGKVFEQFFTTKEQGLGMGLSVSGSIVETHGGKLWLDFTSWNEGLFKFWNERISLCFFWNKKVDAPVHRHGF